MYIILFGGDDTSTWVFVFKWVIKLSTYTFSGDLHSDGPGTYAHNIYI